MTTHYGGAPMHCHPDQRQDYAFQPLIKARSDVGLTELPCRLLFSSLQRDLVLPCDVAWRLEWSECAKAAYAHQYCIHYACALACSADRDV